jgi:hypothetical protein
MTIISNPKTRRNNVMKKKTISSYIPCPHQVDSMASTTIKTNDDNFLPYENSTLGIRYTSE